MSPTDRDENDAISRLMQAEALALGDGLRYLMSVGDRAPPMVVIYTGSFPFDPETELKNFERKQAEYEAAYHHTGEPLALFEALLHARAARQLTPDWLVEAVGGIIMRGRTGQTTERFRERMRHVRRFRCVRDLRQKGHIKDDALDLAVVALKATDAAGRPSTIEDSYDLVKRDLKRAERDNEYSLLVARSDPTVVPVDPTVIARIRGGDRSGNDQGGDRSGNDQSWAKFQNRLVIAESHWRLAMDPDTDQQHEGDAHLANDVLLGAKSIAEHITTLGFPVDELPTSREEVAVPQVRRFPDRLEAPAHPPRQEPHARPRCR
jgi:hypothetical protein